MYLYLIEKILNIFYQEMRIYLYIIRIKSVFLCIHIIDKYKYLMNILTIGFE